MSKYDVAIIGAGPAGLYCAFKLIKDSKRKLKILILEKGNELEKRICPAVTDSSNCKKCKICSIMSGIAGAGAFSDGKFPITNDFGGNLWEKCGKEKSLELQREVDDTNRRFYYYSRSCRNEQQISWLEYNYPEKAFPKLYVSKNSPYKKICTQHNLHLLNADIRHLGTDLSKIVYSNIYNFLIKNNVEIKTQTEVNCIAFNPNSNEDAKYWIGLKDDGSYYADKVVIAAGRTGSQWVNFICTNLGIPTRSNRVDLGIRFECPDEIWNHITKDLYESKIIYRTKTYEDEVRTFCMNPSGYVVTERTNSGITVNGHSFESSDKKSENTNFALLVSQTFTEPFDDSNEYGEAIIKLSNMLGGGVIVQRYGDLIRGRRSTKEHIKHNSVKPTLNAEPGDLSLVLPKRILDDIMEMVEALDHLVPGMINDDNLLYGVEAKFYNSVVETKENCEAEKYPGLYFAGDGAGYTHSLSQASANGLYIAEDILKNC